MDLDTLSIGISGVEAELKALKQQLASLRLSKPSEEKAPHFADLCGVWKGKVDLSLEEIKEAEYRVKPFPSR